MSNLIGAQTQWDSTELLRYLEIVGPKFCMGINVFKWDYLEKVRARGAKYIYRHHPNFDEVPGLTRWTDDPEQAAEDATDFLAGHLAGVLDLVDYVVEGNEYVLGPDHETPERIALADRFMAAFIPLARSKLGVGSIVGNFNTGHWRKAGELVEYFPLMLQALQEDCEANPENGSRIGWHEYNWPLLADDTHWRTATFLRAMPAIIEQYPLARCLITELGVDRAADEWGAPHEGFRKAHSDIDVAIDIFCNGLAWYVDRLLEAEYVDGVLLFGCGMGDWRGMGFDVMNNPEDVAVPERIALLPDAAPVEPPEPPEPPEDSMEIKVVDMDYKERDFPWAETKYGVAVRRAEVEPGQKVYRLVELWEKTGTTSLVSQVLGEDGQPIANISVAFYWSDAPDPPEPATEVYPHDWYRNFIHGLTNVNGDVGPGMGRGAYHGEGEGGPHAVWVHDPDIPSDICEKLGMLAGTFHDHLDQKFKLVVKGEGPPPNGDDDVPLVLVGIIKEPHDVSSLAIAYPTSVATDTRGDGRGPGVDEDLYPKEWVHPDGTAMAMVEVTTDFEGDEPRTYTLRVYRMSDGVSLTDTESETFPPLGAPRERIVYVYVKAGEEPPVPPENDTLAKILATVEATKLDTEEILRILGTSPPVDDRYWAQYYTNKELAGAPILERHEDAIMHDWGDGAPPGVPDDDFSARWTVTRWFDAGTWTFFFRGDDGMRLRVDGVLVFDQWHDQPPTSYDVWMELTEGLHSLEMQYYERGGGAVCQMWYEKG